MAEFASWDSFYLIVGAAPGALIGLQLVVMTLIAQRPPIAAPEAGAAFVTPTIVHFGAVLLLAALLRAPWHAVTLVAVIWAVLGIAGAGYSIIVARIIRKQAAYQTKFEDWLFRVVLPLVAYLLLALSALLASAHTREALFAVGAAVLLLLFVGIHNAWDNITYHVFVNIRKADTELPTRDDSTEETQSE